MQEGHWIYDPTFAGHLNRFKEKVDNTVRAALEFDPVEAATRATNYRKRGGLHFANVAGVNLQWSFKKRPKAKPTPIEEPDAPAERIDLHSGVNGERFARIMRDAKKK